MSEQEKNQNIPQEEAPQEAAPEKAEKAKPKKTAKADKKKADTVTVTKEQMEAMEGLAEKLANLNDQHLRLAAEYENYRKRTAKEKETLYRDGKADTIAKFLDVYDNLERAVNQPGDEENPHKQGMTMIFHQLEEILAKMDVTIEDPKDKEFDPNKHNAVMHTEDESLGENIVSQVFQKGFILGDKVIRPAMVQVAN